MNDRQARCEIDDEKKEIVSEVTLEDDCKLVSIKWMEPLAPRAPYTCDDYDETWLPLSEAESLRDKLTVALDRAGRANSGAEEIPELSTTKAYQQGVMDAIHNVDKDISERDEEHGECLMLAHKRIDEAFARIIRLEGRPIQGAEEL